MIVLIFRSSTSTEANPQIRFSSSKTLKGRINSSGITWRKTTRVRSVSIQPPFRNKTETQSNYLVKPLKKGVSLLLDGVIESRAAVELDVRGFRKEVSFSGSGEEPEQNCFCWIHSQWNRESSLPA